MILEELTLHNFGLYADRQTINLAPPSASKPVILFGGMNGGGKTTLLDALQLCLFGPHAKISNRGSLGYQEYLSRSIHRGSHSSSAAIELSFRHTVEGHQDHYKLHRSWKRTPSGCKEYFEVLKNDRIEPTLAENWASQVEDFIPTNIAHLFLFDGEQIEGYASQHDSSGLIGAAIQNLLGLDVVDQLEKDLLVYERRKRSEEKSDAAQDDISAAEADVRNINVRLESLKQERASLQTHQLDQRKRALTRIEDRFRKLGGHLYEQRKEIEGSYKNTAEAAKHGAEQLRELAAGPLPLLMILPLLGQLRTRDKTEEDVRRSRDVLDILHERDRALLKILGSERATKNLLESVKRHLDQDRSRRKSAGGQRTILDMSSEARSDLHSLLSGQADELQKTSHAQLKHQKKLDAAVEKHQHAFESVPDSDSIAEVSKERSKLMTEIAGLEIQLTALTNEIERSQREGERKQQGLTRLLEADVTARGSRDDRTRILFHAAKVRKTLSQFRRGVIERHVRRIEELVLESYQQLLRKATLVTRLSIDPETYELTLYGRDGAVLSAERLSAGERQLLATALLWGLAKASGRPLPMAIDTPLGRLDTGHRMHLVERYLPFASHQVLLLSTDEEITGEYLEALKPWIGRMYQLEYDDEQGSTRIVPGYFASRRAA